MELEQGTAVFERKAERARLGEEGEPVHIRVREAAVAVLGPVRSNETDVLVVSDCLWRKATSFCDLSDSHDGRSNLAFDLASNLAFDLASDGRRRDSGNWNVKDYRAGRF